jgi:hypothetical protein
MVIQVALLVRKVPLALLDRKVFQAPRAQTAHQVLMVKTGRPVPLAPLAPRAPLAQRAPMARPARLAQKARPAQAEAARFPRRIRA